MNAPAGFWRRYAAYSLDAAILGLLASPLLWWRFDAAWPRITGLFTALQMRMWALFDAALVDGGEPFGVALQSASDPVLREGIELLAQVLASEMFYAAMVLLLVGAAWFIPFESSRWQASPGKRAAGLRVTDRVGARCGPGRIVLRFLAGILSWLLLNLGHALAAWTPGKRALHDYIAGTRVERVEGAPAAMPRWARSWLLLQGVLFFAFNAWVLTTYTQYALDAATAGLP